MLVSSRSTNVYSERVILAFDAALVFNICVSFGFKFVCVVVSVSEEESDWRATQLLHKDVGMLVCVIC